MKIKIRDKQVDVADALCKTRSCFQLGQDKGTFVQGRGYTSYYKNPQWVCLRRMLHGCPHVGSCPSCRLAYLEGATHCERCKTVLKVDDNNKSAVSA
jgi:hypothetical protein